MNKLVIKNDKLEKFQERCNEAFTLVDDVVLKNYISKLSLMEIVPLKNEDIKKNLEDNVRLFKINEMVYQNDEYSTYKFASVFNAVASTKSMLFVIIDSNGEKTEFYMGIKSDDSNISTKTCYDTLANSIKGQFPGIKTNNLYNDEVEELFNNINGKSISIVSGIANNKAETIIENKNFIQGLEKLALSMQGERYTGIILANPVESTKLNEIRKGYENIYTQLSPFANMQVTMGKNNVTNISSAITNGESISENYSTSSSTSRTEGFTNSESISEGMTKQSKKSIAGGAVKATLTTVGFVLGSAIPGPGNIVGAAIGGAIGSVVAAATNETINNTLTSSKSVNESNSTTIGETQGTSNTRNNSTTTTEGSSEGISEGIQLTIQNKKIIDFLERIDTQLERVKEAESVGMWECAAYFMAEKQYVSEIAASTYKSLVTGENSGVEISAINIWNEKTSDNALMIQKYIKNLIHPIFRYNKNGVALEVTGTSLVNGNELAIHMALPRKSVCGFPVIEHANFGREVVRHEKAVGENILLGNIFNLGRETAAETKLNLQSFTMHTFVTGSTGSGKSNTVYRMLEQLDILGINFLVVEPAKGEYKHILGNKKNVTVLGTNPRYTELLKINPFKFEQSTHVLEHIDRLIEIFNVCWPMYAAMPAVLKEAIEKAYVKVGWNLKLSKNGVSENIYPTFEDLLISLKDVIRMSDYSEEVKGNYAGALVTRVKSLTNGINGLIFTNDEVDNEILFDKNVIVDLSRVGSSETKSMIMGILIMRLQEHRMEQGGMNKPIKHVTVLEEAHNILKRTSQEQSLEGSNMIGKSVEMISNSIAEMRTYGEGFIIVDQSPSTVDMSAIRNTNTKIILRLPEHGDRELVGKAASLNNEQIDEVSKLQTGVAVVYQNNWLHPVLCKIRRCELEEKEYKKNIEIESDDKNIKKEIIEKLLEDFTGNKIDDNCLTQKIINSNISGTLKYEVIKLLKEKNKKEIKDVSKLIFMMIENKNIEHAKETNNFKEWNAEIENKLDDFVQELDEEYRILVIQCILRESAKEKKELEKLYFSWAEYMSKEMIL